MMRSLSAVDEERKGAAHNIIRCPAEKRFIRASKTRTTKNQYANENRPKN